MDAAKAKADAKVYSPHLDYSLCGQPASFLHVSQVNLENDHILLIFRDVKKLEH